MHRTVRTLAALYASATLGVLAACDQVAPTGLHPTSAPSLSASSARGRALVTGGGAYSGFFGTTKVAANAVRHADGTVTGQYEQRNPEFGFMMHASLDCASQIGSRVFLSGIITDVQKSGTFGIPEGVGFIVVIEDNGEGRTAPPDRVSPFLYGVPSQACTDEVLQDFLAARMDPLESGNFQVAP